MQLYLATPAAAPVVSLAEMKAHLRVDHSDEDDLITACEAAAVSSLDGADGILGRCLKPQTWRMKLCDFEDDIRIPLPPLVSVTHVKYFNGGTLMTLSASLYEVVGAGATNPACIVPVYGTFWPVPDTKAEAVEVEFQAGYTTVPPALVQAVKLLAGHFYANREAVSVGVTAQEMPLAVQRLTAPFVVHYFG